MTLSVTRAQIDKAVPNADQAFKLTLEQVMNRYGATADSTVAATQAIQDATALTLSPNAGFSSERVLTFDPAGFATEDTGPNGAFVVSLLSSIAATLGFRLEFNLASDTYLDLPASGRVLEATLGNATYIDDAAAAAGGIQVGEVYRKPSGGVGWRQT